MFIGVDIGGTKCAVIRGTAEGTVLEKRRFATTTPEETQQAIIAAAKELAAGQPIRGVGVSCGGPLDEETGVILSPPNLPGWDAVPMAKMLSDALGVPCAVRNDANACALAEWRFGAGRGTRNMIFLTFGTGLGAGLILNGALYGGTNGQAGEVGHIRLAADGPVGYGKAGSFEGFCSGGGLAQLGERLAQDYIARGETPAFWQEGKPADAATLASFARAGDPCAREVFDLCGTRLGEGLSLLVDILNPERIVIGSIFARCTDLLTAPMEAVLRREALPLSRQVCRIVPAELSEQVGDVAALAVAAETVR